GGMARGGVADVVLFLPQPRVGPVLPDPATRDDHGHITMVDGAANLRPGHVDHMDGLGQGRCQRAADDKDSESNADKRGYAELAYGRQPFAIGQSMRCKSTQSTVGVAGQGTGSRALRSMMQATSHCGGASFRLP